ncbi:alpha/beta fold hydrolase [Micromonospora zamorensis]|uniref:alpha/beta fold hydrolase n=1 Tax=Micromonospora zamorensis TaxID=709883 RepID=UPI0033B28E3D
MCHGGWCFEHVTRRLRDLGHTVHPLTLTGVSERSHLLHGTVNLDTHIQDVVAHLEGENLHDTVLVGHSYGGMVITGAADRAADRIDSLVYLDAVVPADGDSCWSLVSDQERRWYLEVDETGCASRALPFFDARATPHPIASVLQSLRLTGDPGQIRRRDYVYAAGWADQSPFTTIYQKLRAEPGWTTHALAGGHNLMRDTPEELTKILADVAASR